MAMGWVFLCATVALGQATAGNPPATSDAARTAVDHPLMVGLSGAAANTPMTAAGQAAVATPTPAPRVGGSLLKASLAVSRDPNKTSVSAVSFFAVPDPEPRTVKKHDLVEIIVREEASFSAQGTTDLKKQTDLDAKINQFIKMNELLRGRLEGGAPQVNVAEISADAERTFKGEGSVDRSDTTTLRLAAEVIDVKPNDTLVLQAKKLVVNDEEEMEVSLSGVCRAADISADNSVLSTQLADVEVRTKHKGAVRDTTKRGLIPKIVDTINPF
jgi:flagellar L-ring protein precursor FlgH